MWTHAYLLCGESVGECVQIVKGSRCLALERQEESVRKTMRNEHGVVENSD
jgi:hypothetical protein